MHACNPIIPGFAPDPSVVRINDTFYLVNSSFHLFPGLPIFASRDLLAWRHIGNAINRSTQLDLSKSATCLTTGKDGSAEKAPATGGLYAPTIRHHNGVTYIVCTNVSNHLANNSSYENDEIQFDNFVISTSNIDASQWSDPVHFDFYGIDPDLFFDDDGRAYVSGSSWRTNPGTINCFEIDLQTGRKLSDEKIIWEGHSKIIPEGPHIYKRAGYYYLLDAEGGTHEGHCIMISRSRSIWGPYESCADNPILRPSNYLNGPLGHSQYHGHGDLIQDSLGNWWLVCLGVRRDKVGRMILGRETFLTSVEWPDNEPWPIIQQPIPQCLSQRNSMGDVESNSDSKICPNHLKETTPSPFYPTLDMVWIRSFRVLQTRITEGGKSISLLPSVGDLCECTDRSASFVGRRQRRLNGSATATLSLDDSLRSPTAKVMTGLAYYKDEHRYARLFWHSETKSVVFECLNRAKAPPISRRKSVQTYNPANMDKKKLRFRIVYNDIVIHFSYRLCNSKSEGSWQFGGLIDTLDMSGADFTGPVIGVFATGLGTEWCTFVDVVI